MAKKLKKRTTDLHTMKLSEVSLVPAGANQHAFISLAKMKDEEEGEEVEGVEKATKTVAGQNYAATDFAYMPDATKPSTWKLLINDAAHVGAAAAALSSGGFRGQKVAIPAADLGAVKAKLRAAWKKFNPDKDPKMMPASIAKSFDEVLDLESWDQELIDEVEEALSKAEEAAQSFDEIVTERTIRQQMWQLMDALGSSVNSILEDDTVTDKGAAIKESLTQFTGAMANMAVGKGDGNSDNGTGGENMPGEKNNGLQKQVTELEKGLGEATTLIEEMKKQLEASEESKKVAEEELSKLKEEVSKSAKKEVEEGIDKSALPEPVRKQLEEIEKESKENKERVAKLEDEAETRNLIAKVEAEFPNLPGENSEIAKTLKLIKKSVPEVMDGLTDLLKSASEAIKTSLMVEKGADGESDMDNNSAEAQLAKKADDIAKRDSITKEAAFVKAMDEYPDLAKRERDERGATAH